MKRFYEEVSTAQVADGWQVMLDARAIKTQGGAAQIAPTKALADILASEWETQGEELDPKLFRARDMIDYALDVIAADPATTAQRIVPYADTDTLCYRAEPEEPLFARQQEVWEPLLSAFEAREGVAMQRISGIMHRPQSAEAMAALGRKLAALDAFTLAALETTTALSASLCIGLSALENGADSDALWRAANLEEDWQAELWGLDEEAEARSAKRRDDFLFAIRFAASARTAD
ncbi:ATP12 family chaperone protein [Qipengyuania sp. DGS5-3]|uniref:ATP12 family chaperone protein n=1 Tax=Qipengyuania sp. DGS5-3 TaxID=3349632 RepID=UPI0036D3F9D5